MSKVIITVVGNLTADPELRFTPSGAAVANFTVADTPRKYDAKSGGYVDGETLFMRCTMWREPGENFAKSLVKGNRVIVVGELVSRTFDDKKTNEKRTVNELQVEEAGPSTRFATTTVERVATKSSTGTNGGGRNASQPSDDDAPPF